MSQCQVNKKQQHIPKMNDKVNQKSLTWAIWMQADYLSSESEKAVK